MALNRIIGYVSISFGKKRKVDFTEIYKTAIFPAPRSVAMSEAENICLFREDEATPQLDDRHNMRLERFGLNKHSAETRLREAIQKHIVLSDFIVADIVRRQNLFNRTGKILRDGFDNFKLKPFPSNFVVFSALKSAF